MNETFMSDKEYWDQQLCPICKRSLKFKTSDPDRVEYFKYWHPRCIRGSKEKRRLEGLLNEKSNEYGEVNEY